MDDCKLPVKINKAHFKEWMTPVLSVTETGTLLQGMGGCNYSGKINRLLGIPKIGLPKN